MSLQGQIRQMLVAAILDGQLLPDHALPSSRELADQLSVARNTVVLAYQQLVEEGYLISRERSGHFVNPGDPRRAARICAAANRPGAGGQ
jgi:Predicted transcriptional regulators